MFFIFFFYPYKILLYFIKFSLILFKNYYFYRTKYYRKLNYKFYI